MFGPRKVEVSRCVSKDEYDWLPYDLPKGSVFYVVPDKWNVCTDYGIAVSLDPHGETYFEIPSDVVYHFLGFIPSIN